MNLYSRITKDMAISLNKFRSLTYSGIRNYSVQCNIAERARYFPRSTVVLHHYSALTCTCIPRGLRTNCIKRSLDVHVCDTRITGKFAKHSTSVVREGPMSEVFKSGSRFLSQDSKDDMFNKLLQDSEMKSLRKDIAKDFDQDEEFAEEYLRDKIMSENKQSEINSSMEKLVDIEHELKRYDYEEFEEYEYDESDSEDVLDICTSQMEYKWGITGVYDIDALVQLLEEENGLDICAIKVPADIQYVDYMVIVSGRSSRHLKAIAHQVQWQYKKMRSRSDPPFVKVEGFKTCSDWLAIDLGNIALHLFMPNRREYYDLETLWTVGDIFDKEISAEESDDPFAMFLNTGGDASVNESDGNTHTSHVTNSNTAKSVSNEGSSTLRKGKLEMSMESGKWHS